MSDPTLRILIVVCAICLAAGMMNAVILGSLTLGILTFTVTFGTFVLQGIRVIPTVHKALLKEWGERIPVVKNEGLRFFPLMGIWLSYEIVNVAVENLDVEEQALTTPDGAKVTAPLSLTWYPDHTSGAALITYLNTIGKATDREPVNDILRDIARERLRGWASSDEEGPKTWRQAIGASFEASAMVLKAVVGEALEPVNSLIPTGILMRYFPARNRRMLRHEELTRWGAELNALEANPAELARVTGVIQRRREDVEKARRGKGDFQKPNPGIIITRLNIGEMQEAAGDEIVAADKLKKREVFEREAQKIEIAHVRARAKEIKKQFPSIPDDQCLTLAQIHTGKVTKKINEINVPPHVAEMVARFLGGRR